MDSSVAELRVAITAGGAGIGLATAKHFIRAGARVHICDIEADRSIEAHNTLPDIGTTVADVSDPNHVDRFVAEALEHLGGLDVLVNNAGISGPTARVEDVLDEDWSRTLAVNLDGQFYSTRRFVPHLKANSGGSIVNISSTAGLFSYPFRTPYAASKWAVIGFTKSLAMELGEFGIRVNAICPGSIEGERMDGIIEREAAAKGVPPEELRAAMVRQSSLRTLKKPEEIADTILFLCSPTGKKISSQAIAVDGHSDSLRT